MAGLEVVQNLLNERGKLLAPCSTRWLSTERSVNRLKKCFVSVVVNLQHEGEEISDAKALGLNSLGLNTDLCVPCFCFVMLYPTSLIYQNVFRLLTVIIASFLEW